MVRVPKGGLGGLGTKDIHDMHEVIDVCLPQKKKEEVIDVYIFLSVCLVDDMLA